MRPLLRLLPRQILDRIALSVAALALLLLFTAPLLLRTGSGFADGLAAGGNGGANSASGLLALLLALVAPWLAQGVVSGLRHEGGASLVFSRPVSRWGYFLSRWLAGLLCLVGVSVTACVLINLAWQSSVGPGLAIPGAVSGGVVTWIWVGSAVLLLSAVLRRGETLGGSLLVAIPAVLTASLPAQSGAARFAAALPTRAMLRSTRDLLSGGPAAPGDLLAVLGWSLVVLSAGLLVAAHRDVRCGD